MPHKTTDRDIPTTDNLPTWSLISVSYLNQTFDLPIQHNISPERIATFGSADQAKQASGMVLGIDEVGRGALVGDVCVAGVLLPDDPSQAHTITGLTDSKKLTASKRQQLESVIRAQASAYSIVQVPPDIVDQLNILQATLLGMFAVIQSFRHIDISQIRIDGNQMPRLPADIAKLTITIVGGDGLDAAISAASILAKVSRDVRLITLGAQHPEYGFERHKGYATRQHITALQQHGAIAEHRLSFAPVKRAIGQLTLSF